MRDLYSQELQFLQNNLLHYLNYWPADPEWMPAPSMYSFLELANHLYTLPAAYSAQFKGTPEGELLKIWGSAKAGRSKEELRSLLLSGVSDLQTFIQQFKFTDEDELIPWPFGVPLTPQGHLLNCITHIYHHRGQMHNYLKELGAEVDTGTIYTG